MLSSVGRIFFYLAPLERLATCRKAHPASGHFLTAFCFPSLLTDVLSDLPKVPHVDGRLPGRGQAHQQNQTRPGGSRSVNQLVDYSLVEAAAAGEYKLHATKLRLTFCCPLLPAGNIGTLPESRYRVQMRPQQQRCAVHRSERVSERSSEV